MYTKSIIMIAFILLVIEKANIIILSHLPLAFSKYACISFKQIFE